MGFRPYGFGDAGDALLSGPRTIQFLGQWYQLPNGVAAPGSYGLMTLDEQAQWLAIYGGHPEAVGNYVTWKNATYPGEVGGELDYNDGGNPDDTWFNRNIINPIFNAASPGVDDAYNAGQYVTDNSGRILEAGVFGTSLGLGIGTVGTIAVVGFASALLYVFVSAGGSSSRRRS